MEDEEESTRGERARTVLLIAKKYEKHPLVGVAVNTVRNNNSVTKPPEDLIGRYLQEIGQYNLLNEEDEQRLFGLIEVGLATYQKVGTFENLSSEDELALIELAAAYQVVYVTNLRLVVDIAKRHYYMEPEDIIQEGNAGLSAAITRFHISRGFKFSTYATHWIRQSITRAIADKSRTVRLPVHMHEKWMKMRYSITELDKKLDRQPTREEIANHMGEPIKTINLLLDRGDQEIASLDESFDEDDGSLSDTLVEPVDTLDARMDELDNAGYIERMFSAPELSVKEQFVLSARLGQSVSLLRSKKIEVSNGQTLSYESLISAMDNTDDGSLTLGEVGELLGVSRERIRQIELDGLKKIREGYFRR